MFIKDYPESDDAAIASMIISLAKNLNVDLIAEGMETEEQVRFLKENGCTIMQGYYFSKPLTVDDFIKKIEDQSNKT
jgi:EAL domain-containing protein (putative c-di-GMP-specific phosphodiesterase class I)